MADVLELEQKNEWMDYFLFQYLGNRIWGFFIHINFNILWVESCDI